MFLYSGPILSVGIFFILSLFLPVSAFAGQTIVAVASNFSSPAKSIARAFEQETGQSVILSFGSTGKLYAQITKGAPYQVFLGADEQRPGLTEENGLAVHGSRFTYARGRLVLWGLDDAPRVLLEKGGFTRLAIANPKTAPYGAAAVEVLNGMGLWAKVKDKVVRGENIAQTFQFVATGNAELGFVSASQVIDKKGGWPVPEEFYQPINQQAVLLTKGKDNQTAIAFLDFLKSDKAKKIIQQFGYGIE